MEHHDLFSGLIRLHVLHHAAEGELYGAWMIEELARHGYRLSPGTLGGFKRSSQHSKVGGCDEHSKAAVGAVWTGAINFTRTAACGGTR